MQVEQRSCTHCHYMNGMGLFHTKMCNCTHHHSDHVFTGGCKVKDCKCEGYDQRVSNTAIPKTITTGRYSSEGKNLPMASLVDIDKLAEQINSTNELADAQARVQELKKRKEEICEKEEAKSISTELEEEEIQDFL